MSEQSGTQSETRISWHWLWQAIIIAAIPILGYMLAYISELAFCSVFGIPHEFIVISWPNILIGAFSVLAVIIAVLSFTSFGLLFLPKRVITESGPIGRRLMMHVLFFALLAGMALRYQSVWPEILWVIPFLMFLLFWDFVFPLLKWKSVSGYRNKLEAQAAFQKRREGNTLVDDLLRRIGRGWLVVIVIIVFLFTMFFLDGYDRATMQKVFLIPSTNQELVVLRVYGDNLICAPLDREAREIEKRFFILKASELELTPQEVGPLRVSSSMNN